MAKVRLTNSFHKTEIVTSIKDIYFDSSITTDVMIALDGEVTMDGEDKVYAQRKLKEIRNALCPYYGDCKCTPATSGEIM